MKTYFENRFVREKQLYDPSYSMDTYMQEAYGKGRWIRRLWEAAQAPAGDMHRAVYEDWVLIHGTDDERKRVEAAKALELGYHEYQDDPASDESEGY